LEGEDRRKGIGKGRGDLEDSKKQCTGIPLAPPDLLLISYNFIHLLTALTLELINRSKKSFKIPRSIAVGEDGKGQTLFEFLILVYSFH